MIDKGEDKLNSVMIDLTWSSKDHRFDYPKEYDDVIPKKGKIPKRAVQWLDSLTTEEIMILHYRYESYGNEKRYDIEELLLAVAEILQTSVEEG